ncbi:MAG: transglutaminase family protein [Luteitalea sp.]|nr:transglutaminase family protein [Luteitalea sp.]
MRCDVTHTTEYEYSESVVVAHHVAHLRPRTLPHQECLHHELAITPAPAVTSAYEDYFGNLVTFFAVQGAHERLVIRARSTVTVSAPERPPPRETPPWEAAADRAALPFDAVEFVFASPESRPPWSVDAYARASFPAGRPLLDAVLELTARIHDEFTFDPKATTVATPLAEVLASRRGVCQDFARLEIACLRSLGIPARYVSGYLETVPPPSTPRLLGADASHAWLTVYCPGVGWIPVDPTNNLLPSDGHVTLAWGRDYTDVSPIHGVILGGGAHSLRVHVDVVRLADGEPGRSDQPVPA